MSISPLGPSDPYARYRQQALDLIAPATQPGTQAPQTTAPSYVTPPVDTTDQSANPFAAKFKADLSALNSSRDGNNGHHGHHHKTSAANETTASATDATANTTAPTDTTDTFGQSLDAFAKLLKSAVGIAAAIV